MFSRWKIHFLEFSLAKILLNFWKWHFCIISSQIAFFSIFRNFFRFRHFRKSIFLLFPKQSTSKLKNDIFRQFKRFLVCFFRNVPKLGSNFKTFATKNSQNNCKLTTFSPFLSSNKTGLRHVTYGRSWTNCPWRAWQHEVSSYLGCWYPQLLP